MPNDLYVTDNETTIDASQEVSSITLSEQNNTIESTADKTEINVIQQVSDINIIQAETTEIKLQEQVTSIIAGTPDMSGSFSGNVTIPYLSSYKTTNPDNGLGFSLGMTDSETTSLNAFGTSGFAGNKLKLDAKTILINAVGSADLYGRNSSVTFLMGKLQLGSEAQENGLPVGMEFSSSGTPYTGLFILKNTTLPNNAASHCPFLILKGRSGYGTNDYQDYLHLGIDDNSNPLARIPYIANPEGFGFRVAYSANSVYSGIHPTDENGDVDDANHSMGSAYARWYALYAATSQIITSDENQKQDIEHLNEAEERVAVACKSLLRKFKLIRSVEEKGDDARTHFGIIAQDLQQAFINEGLDPAKYAMFCSDTWYEHDGKKYPERSEAPSEATEVTQLGVRYEQLLAFIISAI